MDNSLNTTNPTFVDHEGFYYLVFEGAFYKGCTRCGGEGHFSHNGEHSRCYDCNNTSAKLGAELESQKAAEKWCHERAVRKAQRDRLRENKRLAEVAKMVANQELLKQADAEVYEFLMGVVLDDSDQYASYEEWASAQNSSKNNSEKDVFIRNMAEALTFVAYSKPFTPKMIAAVRSSMERRQQRLTEAAEHPAPTGRVAVTGEIISAKMVEGDYGTSYKILVKDDKGFKVWVSLPGAQATEAIESFEANNDPSTVGYGVWFLGSVNEPELFTGVKGRRITFMAKLEPSTDDAAFAFGSRPTKGSWL